MLSSAIAMLNAFMPHLEHHLIGHLLVALVVSALSCLMLVSLDKVADALKASGDAESTVHIIQHVILAHGLLIGISWEAGAKILGLWWMDVDGSFWLDGFVCRRFGWEADENCPGLLCLGNARHWTCHAGTQRGCVLGTFPLFGGCAGLSALHVARAEIA